MKFSTEKLVAFFSKSSENSTMKSIQKGLMSTVSILIIGGLAVLLASPPGNAETATGFIAAWINFASSNANILNAIKFATHDLIALWTLIGVAYMLAKELKQDILSSIFLSGVLFLMFTYSPIEGGIAISFFGSAGIFTAMVTPIFAIYLSKFLVEKNIKLKFPSTVPDMVAKPFEALIPLIFVIVLGIIINSICGIFSLNFPMVIVALFRPLVSFSDSLFGVLLIAFLIHGLWGLGIHGGAVVMPIIMPLMIQKTMENMEVYAAGGTPENIFTVGFHVAFIMPLLGLSLAIMIVAKSAHLKTVGKVGFIPMLFNITEPVGFGAPVVLNPPLAIGRIVSGLVTTTIAYLVFAAKIVQVPIFQVPFTLPGFIVAFMASADWKAIVLWFIVIAISTFIYIPFVKVYDTQLLTKEQEGEN